MGFPELNAGLINAKPSACNKKYRQVLPEKQDLTPFSKSCYSYSSNFVICPQFADAALPAIYENDVFSELSGKTFNIHYV
jgi:hypothetical protein